VRLDILSYSEVASIIEEIVRLPTYAVIGIAGRQRLIYLSTQEGSSDLYSLDLETGERIRITSGERVLEAATHPDSSLFPYIVDTTPGKELSTIIFADAHTGRKIPVDGFKPSRIVGLAFDGEKAAFSSVIEGGSGIWIARPGGTAELIHRVTSFIYVSSVRGDITAGAGWLTGDARSSELFFLNIPNRRFDVYTPRKGSTNSAPRIGEKGVLFESNYAGPQRLYVLDPGSMKLEPLKTSYRDHVRRRIVEHIYYDWMDRDRAWFLGKRDGRVYLYADGREIPLPPGYSGSATYYRAKNTFILSRSSLRSPPSLISVELGGSSRALASARTSSRIVRRIGRSYFVRIRSFDGLEIPTFVMESNVAPKPGPTVIYVHGGPWWEVADRWDTIISTLVASGYHVVAPNFRGSTGYGEEFRRLDIGDPGGGDLQDVVSTAKWAREVGLASKIAIFGYSYGGFMSVWATVREPDVWDAAVAGASVPDWEEMYELGDALFKQFALLLFDGKRELWKERSAINYAERLKAPICLIHPQNDTRTPLRPVLRYAQKLLELGKRFELHIIPDMGHYIADVKSAMEILLPGILFLNKTLSR
jgi:dipeptidyl aminopeptidase/acylaminoacyl peptidase